MEEAKNAEQTTAGGGSAVSSAGNDELLSALEIKVNLVIYYPDDDISWIFENLVRLFRTKNAKISAICWLKRAKLLKQTQPKFVGLKVTLEFWKKV